MVTGFYAEGRKLEVIASIRAQVAKQKIKFEQDCRNVNVPVYGPSGSVIRHDPNPLKFQSTVDALEACLQAAIEQLEHVNNDHPDEETIAVSCQLTVHRPNPSNV